MTTETLVMAALKETAPALHRQLTESGELAAFVEERAQAIREQIVEMTMAQRFKEKWDSMGAMECAGKMKMANAINREIVHAELLTFPQES